MSYRWLIAAALALYCLAGALLIAQNPGLQYDEALLVAGGVALRHPSPVESLQATPDTWMCRRGFCFPLMAEGSYIGAIKEILSVPAFSIAGPRAWVARAVSMLLALFGLWGIMHSVKSLAGPAAAAGVGLVLAINPSFINMTVFDNGAVAATMAALGLFAVACSRYVTRPAVAAMFWIGAAAGLGMWTRANFIWTLAAVAVALAIVLRRQIIVPLTHAAALVGGILVGGLPLWIYQVASGGGTFAALDLNGQATGSWAELLYLRLIMLAEVLLMDAEHTVMWGSSTVPAWLRWTVLAFITAAAIVCLAVGRRFARITALSTLLLVAFLFASRLQIAEHHLISVVPFAATIAVLAAAAILERFPPIRSVLHVGLALTAMLYAGFCVYWLAREAQGLRQTGGLTVWSDAIFDLTRISEAKAAGRVVKAVDWGFSDNIYVLSDGRVQARDAFNLEHPSISLAGRPWRQEIQEGGLFLISGSDNRQFSAPMDEFLKALREAQPVLEELTIPTRQGTTFARLIDIHPDSLGRGQPASFSETFEINLGDPLVTGLHPAEGQPWRWSGPRFSVVLNRGSINAPWLDVQLFVPEVSIEKLSRITLSGKVGESRLAPETFTHAGEFTYSRPIDVAWFSNGSAKVEFELDKWLPASATDSRELGLVVRSIRLHAR